MADKEIKKPARQLSLKNKSSIRALDVSPDGSRLLVSQEMGHNKHNNLSIWSVKKWDHVQDIIMDDPEDILMARFLNDGQKIAIVDTNMFPYIYDFDTQSTSQINIENKDVQWLSPASQAPYIVVAGESTQVY